MAFSEIDGCLDRSADNVVHAPDLAPHLGKTTGGLLPHQIGCARPVMGMNVRFGFWELVAVPFH